MDMVMFLVNVAAAEPLVPIGIQAHAGEIVRGDFRPFCIPWLFPWGTGKAHMEDRIFDSRAQPPRCGKLTCQVTWVSTQDIPCPHHRDSPTRVIFLAGPKQVFQPPPETVSFCYVAFHRRLLVDDMLFVPPYLIPAHLGHFHRKYVIRCPRREGKNPLRGAAPAGALALPGFR